MLFGIGLRDMFRGDDSDAAKAASERLAEVLILERHYLTGKEE